MILTAFFPVLFREYWSSRNWATQGLAISAILTQLMVAMLAPLVAKLASSKGSSSLIILAFALLGSILTSLLAFTPPDQEITALIFFTAASILYFLSIALQDGLLLFISSPQERHKLSLLAYAFGYLGGGLALLISLLLVKKDASYFKLVFLGVGAWWFIFSLPLLSIKHEKSVNSSLKACLIPILNQKRVVFFLIAYFLYMDGVGTIIRFGVDFGLSISLSKEAVLSALLLVQFIGFPSTFLMLGLSRLIGPLFTLLVCLAVYFFISLNAFFISKEWHFFALAIAISLVQGGTQALSRSIFSNMLNLENSFVGFALFNIVTKFAGIIGPAIMFLSAEWLGTNRPGVFALAALFSIGALLVWKSQNN